MGDRAVSAEQDLIDGLLEGGHWSGSAEKMVDAFAHELAEEQRDLLDKDPWIARTELIDLIDPEVKK